MGFFISTKKDEEKKRKFYINLLSSENIEQPEKFCGNEIKTTHYTL